MPNCKLEKKKKARSELQSIYTHTDNNYVKEEKNTQKNAQKETHLGITVIFSEKQESTFVSTVHFSTAAKWSIVGMYHSGDQKKS